MAIENILPQTRFRVQRTLKRLNFGLINDLGTTMYNIVDFSQQTVEFKLEVNQGPHHIWAGIMIDDDFDIILEKHNYGSPPISAVYFIVPNRLGCHSDCDICFEPGKSDKCLRCKDGLRKVAGKCVSLTVPCPIGTKENALKECQACDRNDPTKSNCSSCELSLENICTTCGPFSQPNIDFPPSCGCTGFTQTISNGVTKCISPQCTAIVGCSECDVKNRCVKCTDPTHLIKNEGMECGVSPCPLSTFLQEKNIGQSSECKKCPVGCLQCNNFVSCDQCEPEKEHFGGGYCNKFKFPLKFSINDTINDKNVIKDYTTVIDVEFRQGDDTKLDANYLQTYASAQKFNLFKFQPEDAVKYATFSLLNPNIIRIFLKIDDKYSDQQLRLKVSGDPNKNLPGLKIDTQAQEVITHVPAVFSPQLLQKMSSNSRIIGSANKYTGDTADYVSFALASSNLDSSGHLLKFSEINKMFSRFRFLNIPFGKLTDTYFREASKKYDPSSSKSYDYIAYHSKGYFAKFNEEKSSLTIFENSMTDLIIYLVAWVLKFQSFFILWICSQTQNISRFLCHFINFSQQFHFVAFNKIVLDLIFYGFRTLTHVKDISEFEFYATLFLIFLVIFDIFEIWQLISSTEITES